MYYNYIQSTSEYSDTVTFQDPVQDLLHLHHQENLVFHTLCTRIHWTAAGALAAQGEAEMSTSSKIVK